MFSMADNEDEKQIIKQEKKIADFLQKDIDKGVELEEPFALYKMIEDGVKTITFLPIVNTNDKK